MEDYCLRWSQTLKLYASTILKFHFVLFLFQSNQLIANWLFFGWKRKRPLFVDHSLASSKRSYIEKGDTISDVNKYR